MLTLISSIEFYWFPILMPFISFLDSLLWQKPSIAQDRIVTIPIEGTLFSELNSEDTVSMPIALGF